MAKQHTPTHTLTAVTAALVVVLVCGCGWSKPLPTIDNVTDGMLMAYPGATVTDERQGEAHDESYLDSGGWHQPFVLGRDYQLAKPTKRDTIFAWARRRADKIGLTKCRLQPSDDQVEPKYIQLICDTKQLTGYPGAVTLIFRDAMGAGQATSADGFATKYRIDHSFVCGLIDGRD